MAFLKLFRRVPLAGCFFTPSPLICAAVVFVGIACLRADDWPQWQGPRRDSEWRETGILRKFPASGPTVLWRTPIGAGYSGPAVAKGKIYVCDRVEAKTGTNDVVAAMETDKERVLCLDEADGKILWQYQYDCKYTFSYAAGPRATPSIVDNKVYVLGAEARLSCLDAQTGSLIWSKELKKDYQAKTPIWGFAGHPLVDGQKIICMVGGKDSLVVALDKDTGKELWHALDAREIGYCPPVIFDAGGRRQLVIFYPEGLASLDPESGKVFWTQPYSTQVGLTISTPRKLDDLILVTSFYNGPMMVRLAKDRPEASLAWKGKSASEINTEGLHSIISTPFLEKGLIYGVCSYGQLRCLRAETGERLWESYAATTGGAKVRWANAFLIKNSDVFFLANEGGDLIIARLSEKGYEELSRAHLLEPTNRDCGRLVVWSHPAFADKSVFARNDKEIIRVSLAE